MKSCKRCLYDETIEDCIIEENGICNYCIRHDMLEKEYPNNDDGKRILDKIIAEIKEHGSTNNYDCVIGISGGCDSSYLLDFCVKSGLRPLAVHFNNGWDTDIAKHNMMCMCAKLNIDFIDYSVDPNEMNDIFRAFLLSGVIDIDAPTDIGLITALYKVAHDNGIKYIVEGHSFRTEGIQPLSWAYVDGKYISDVHKKYGSVPMKTYPNLWMKDFIRWVCIDKIKRVRPLYYLDYNKKQVKRYLKEKYDWKDYSSHHCENDFTRFNYDFFLRQKVQVDERVNEYSALIRSGQMDRNEALNLIKVEVKCPAELIKKIKTRLNISDNQFEEIMSSPIRTYHDFKTYKRFFILTKPLWFILYKAGIVPKSFYLKYCFKNFAQ